MLSETLIVFTPLGIRFWDPVLDRQVVEGLDVRAYPPSAPGHRRRAFRTASGHYAFQGLPGLHDVEYPQVDPRVGSPPAPLPFVVTVVDDRRRYLPVAFEVQLPLPYRGLYQIVAPGSPAEETLPGFYLFPAATRQVPPGLAAVRAQLVDAEAGTPAAYALAAVQTDGDNTWYGMADRNGSLLIILPYPPFRPILHTSPPGSPPAPAGPQRWPLALSVYYDPPGVVALPGTDVPDFRSISAQAPGRLWPDQVGPPVERLETELSFSQELVLRTEGLSSLLVSARSSLS